MGHKYIKQVTTNSHIRNTYIKTEQVLTIIVIVSC